MAQSLESVKNVALLCGGKSGEREISLASGAGAKEALDAAGFNVTILDPANAEDLQALIDGDFDVAFLATHGKGGEDGPLQGFLETIGLPYTGSNVLSSAIAMDKGKSKVFYELAGLTTPPGRVITNDNRPSAKALIEELGENCVVKPSTEGSSLGVFIVSGEEAIERAIDEALTYDKEVLVERQIRGRELTVAVVGNEEPEALPVIEIIPTGEFYDFESKYAPGGSLHVCPAEIDPALAEELQQKAICAHKVLGCGGFDRSDFIVDDEGTCWILETNTLPGMTTTSLVPDAARAAGIPFPDLCRRVIGHALDRASCTPTSASHTQVK